MGSPLGLILLILIIVALIGGFGTRYGGWGGASYYSYGTPGISIGGILIVILIFLLVTGRL